MKRLSIRVKDEDPQIKTWLDQQNNVSASLRLLILQAARLNSQDYVMHCASQVGTPPEQVSGTVSHQPILTEQVVVHATPSDPQDDLLDEDDDEIEPLLKIRVEDDIVDEPIETPVEAPIDTPIIEEDEPVIEQKGAPTAESLDSSDDDGDDLTNRLLSDLRRPSRHNGGMVGTSVEDVMINASRNN